MGVFCGYFWGKGSFIDLSIPTIELRDIFTILLELSDKSDFHDCILAWMWKYSSFMSYLCQQYHPVSAYRQLASWAKYPWKPWWYHDMETLSALLTLIQAVVDSCQWVSDAGLSCFLYCEPEKATTQDLRYMMFMSRHYILLVRHYNLQIPSANKKEKTAKQFFFQ